MLNFERRNNYYYCYKDKILLYKESSQHISAVTKLMRIKKQNWFEFIEKILELNNFQDPKKLNLPLRLKLFQRAFNQTLKKNYPHYNPVVIKSVIKCPNCDSTKFKKDIFVNEFSRPFTIKVCAVCALGTQFPLPLSSEIEKIYQSENYFSGNTTQTGYYNYARESKWRIEKANKYLNQVLRATKLDTQNIRALDVGCGYGYFVKALNDRSIYSDGLEVSSEARNFAKNNYGLNLIPEDLSTALRKGKINENSYNLITLWDVIEHFSDLNSQIKTISKLLKPGGFIALRTNNLDSIEEKIFGPYFHSIKNEHLFYFSPSSLENIFLKHGLKKIKSWTHTHIFLAFMSIKERNIINKNNQGGDIFYICQKN